MEGVLEALRYLLPAVLTVLGAFILAYLKDLRDRVRGAEAKAVKVEDRSRERDDGIRAELNEFKVEVARRYVTNDELVRAVGRFEEAMDRFQHALEAMMDKHWAAVDGRVERAEQRIEQIAGER